MSSSFLKSALLVVVFGGTVSSAQLLAQSITPDVNDDHAIEERLRFRFETDQTLKKYDLNVNVVSRVVTIAGDVATSAQKAEATRLARIAGVSKITNTIVVNKDVDATLAERAKAGLTKTGEKLTDRWITSKVRWFLSQESLLREGDIRVETSDHEVTLAGVVTSSAAKERAVQLAKGTDGVVRVIDQLMLLSPSERPGKRTEHRYERNAFVERALNAHPRCSETVSRSLRSYWLL